MNKPMTTPRRRRPTPAVLLIPSLVFLCLGAGSQGDKSGERIEATRATLEKWFETRRLLSKEQRDWTLGRETLQGRIDVVQGEIDTLKGKLAEATQSITEADTKRSELQRESERLKEASRALGETIASFEGRVKALLARLPDPIRERVKPLSQRLPEDPLTTKLSLGERFQNVVGILNEVDKFNREITMTSEVRALPDGTSTEVTALYVGLGQGYYASANGLVAGVGAPSDAGWTWKPANALAPDVRAVIQMLENERPASFVSLPVEIR